MIAPTASKSLGLWRVNAMALSPKPFVALQALIEELRCVCEPVAQELAGPPG